MPDGHLSTLWVSLSIVNTLQYDKTKILTDIMMHPDLLIGTKLDISNAHMETIHIINGLPLSVYIANVDVKSMINVSH